VDERITVTVDDGHIAGLHEVAQQLTEAGMNVDQVLGTVGIITGSAPSNRCAALERVPGVTTVEKEHTFQLPPPDADVQ
jgi:hypothetical protein